MQPAAGSVWSIRDFRIAWAGGLVNDTGDWLLMVALPVYVFTQTGSGGATAVLFVCQLVAGGLLGPYAGSLVDRWDLRRCLVATNLTQAVTLLPLLAVTAARIWPAYLVVVAQAALTQVNNPANVALLPRLVASHQLTSANAALAASSSVARFVGSPLGGILVVWRGLGPVVAIDAVSFVVVAVAIGRITSDTAPIPSGHDASIGVRPGWRATADHPPLRRMMAIEGFAQLAQGGFVVLFVVFVVQALGDDGAGVGIIRGTMAIGGLAGAALIGRLARRFDPVTLFGVGLVGMGAVSLVFWNAPTVTTDIWFYVVVFSLSGIPGAAMAVGFLTIIQTVTPPAIIGRVVGVVMAYDAVGAALGSVLAGLLVDRVSLRWLLDAQAAVYLAAGALVFGGVSRAQRSRRPRPARDAHRRRAGSRSSDRRP